MNGEFVADIIAGSQDSTGVAIETVYCKVGMTYAVYRTHERVMVQFADDPALGKDQRLLLSPLNPTRGEINGLIDGWRLSRSSDENAVAKLFDRRVADGLTVALQGQPEHALALLSAVKADVMEERTSAARRDYLLIASATMMLIVAASLVLYRVMENKPFNIPLEDGLSLAGLLSWPAAIGSVGAFFSIALAIRSRTILTDLQTNDNRSDAILRIVIGSLSAVILVCLLSGKLVAFAIGDTPIGSDALPLTSPALMLVIAFLAGFSERMVGNLLDRSSLAAPGTPATNPLAGGRVAPAVPSSGANADEQNPLGKPRPPASQDRPVIQGVNPRRHAAEEEEVDGCCSNLTLTDDELTEDIDLPPATGGVETRAA